MESAFEAIESRKQSSAVVSNLIESSPESADQVENDLIDIEIDIQPPPYLVEGKKYQILHSSLFEINV